MEKGLLRVSTEEVDKHGNLMKITGGDEDEGKRKQSNQSDLDTKSSVLIGLIDEKNEPTVIESSKLSEEQYPKSLDTLGRDENPILLKQLRLRGKDNAPKNAGLCWMVVFVSFLSYFLFAGTRGSMGIIQTAMTKTLKDGSTGLEWTGALVNSVPLLLAPLISALAKVTSCTVLSSAGGVLTFAGFLTTAFTSSLPVLLVSLGLCPGFGLGLIAISSTFMVSECFEERRGLAMALSVAGGGLGFVVFPVVLSALMTYYGPRGTLLLCSALYLNGILFGAIYRQKEKRSKRKKAEKQFMLKEIKNAVWDKTLCHSTQCVSLILSSLVFGFCDTILFLFLPSKATSIGFSLELSAMLISTVGFTSISGRIGTGVLTGKSRRRRFVLFVMSFVVCSASMALYATANSYMVFILGSCLFGVSTGSLYSLLPVVLIDLFGIEKFAASFAVSNFSFGIGSLAAGPLSGAVSGLLQSADFPFYAGGVAMALGALSLVFTKYPCRKLKAGTKKKPEAEENIFVLSYTPFTGAPAA